jgi:hypothetical protein
MGIEELGRGNKSLGPTLSLSPFLLTLLSTKIYDL